MNSYLDLTSAVRRGSTNFFRYGPVMQDNFFQGPGGVFIYYVDNNTINKTAIIIKIKKIIEKNKQTYILKPGCWRLMLYGLQQAI